MQAKIASEVHGQRVSSNPMLTQACGFIGESAQQTYANAEPPLESNSESSYPQELSKWLEDIVNDCARDGISTPSQDAFPVELENLATQSDLSVLEGLRRIARASQLWISVGGLHVQVDDPGVEKVYNTHLILDPEGTIKAVYRKIHLFDVSIPGKVQLKESNSTSPGREVVLCDTPIGTCCALQKLTQS